MPSTVISGEEEMKRRSIQPVVSVERVPSLRTEKVTEAVAPETRTEWEREATWSSGRRNSTWAGVARKLSCRPVAVSWSSTKGRVATEGREEVQ